MQTDLVERAAKYAATAHRDGDLHFQARAMLIEYEGRKA